MTETTTLLQVSDVTCYIERDECRRVSDSPIKRVGTQLGSRQSEITIKEIILVGLGHFTSVTARPTKRFIQRPEPGSHRGNRVSEP